MRTTMKFRGIRKMFMVVARAETEPNKINYTSIKDSLNNKLVFYSQSTGTVISGR